MPVRPQHGGGAGVVCGSLVCRKLLVGDGDALPGLEADLAGVLDELLLRLKCRTELAAAAGLEGDLQLEAGDLGRNIATGDGLDRG